VQPGYEVSAAGNYYFIVVSALLIGILGTWVTESLVERRLPVSEASVEAMEQITPRERRALLAVGWYTLLIFGLLFAGLLPEDGVLRDAATGGILRSPFMTGIVIIISVYAAIAGLIYGRVSGRFGSANDFVEGMETSMATMASYLVLMFFAAQFINYFAWSQLGIIAL